MKELSIKEKAKAYDLAIEAARCIYNNMKEGSNFSGMEDLEVIFPELAESKDEKIRKSLLEYLHTLPNHYAHSGVCAPEWIAWLEKQKSIDVLDEEEREFADNVDSYRKEVDTAYQKGYNEGVMATLEKQGEPTEINPSEFDSQLNRLLKQFESLPKDDIASSLSFYLNVVQNDGTYKEEKQDEKIRKALIFHYQGDGCICTNEYRIDFKDIRTWLEKQGEHANFRDFIQVGDKVTRNQDGVLVNLSQLNRVAKKDEKQGEQKSIDDLSPQEIMDIAVAKCFEQGKQKPFDYENVYIQQNDFTPKLALEAAREEKIDNHNCIKSYAQEHIGDKVEPKFKVGDWVVSEVTGTVYQIKNCVENVGNHKYGYDLTNGFYICSDYVNHYHLWTIQDAKDGDVLYECNEKKPFIFKELKTKHIGDIASYCDIFNDVFNPNEDNWTTLNIAPATKEQSDLLFLKMKEAGYEWNAEKKELEKIEQLADKTESNFKFKVGQWIVATGKCIYRITKIDGFNVTLVDVDNNEYVFDVNSLNNARLLNIADSVDECIYEYEKGRADAIAEMQKTWSEEDERYLSYAIYAVEDMLGNNGKNTVTWLKSLRPQSQWKPSDEQMEALFYEVNAWDEDSVNGQNLKSLYQDLKKLREE